MLPLISYFAISFYFQYFLGTFESIINVIAFILVFRAFWFFLSLFFIYFCLCSSCLEFWCIIVTFSRKLCNVGSLFFHFWYYSVIFHGSFPPILSVSSSNFYFCGYLDVNLVSLSIFVFFCFFAFIFMTFLGSILICWYHSALLQFLVREI